MTTLLVFDPALCCSTGICGPEVDDALVRFAADVEWLKGRGVDVRRYNLAQEAGAFAEHRVVQRALMEQGVDCLPLLVLEGEVVAQGAYPDRSELSRIVALTDGDAPAPPRRRPLQGLPLQGLPVQGLPVQGLPVQGCAPDSGCC
jgi:hypothetical protein